MAPQPAVTDPEWNGADPATNTMYVTNCDGPSTYEVRPNGAPAAPPPPDPAVLARQAIAQLTVPAPTIGVGPGDRSTVAVNLWTWFWVDQQPPITATVALGGVSVTATAVLTSTTWSLGEPAPVEEGGYRPGPPVTMTCAGPGTPPPPGFDWKAEPPCGHKFAWRSLKERTGGTGMWPIRATTTWAVTWQSTTGAGGTAELTGSTADQLDVGEYRIVLVQPGSG